MQKRMIFSLAKNEKFLTSQKYAAPTKAWKKKKHFLKSMFFGLKKHDKKPKTLKKCLTACFFKKHFCTIFFTKKNKYVFKKTCKWSKSQVSSLAHVFLKTIAHYLCMFFRKEKMSSIFSWRSMFKQKTWNNSCFFMKTSCKKC